MENNINKQCKEIVRILMQADKKVNELTTGYAQDDRRRAILLTVSLSITDLYQQISDVVAANFISDALEEE